MAAVTYIGSRGELLTNACRHPDKNLGSEEESKEKFNQVHAAYTKLLAEDSDEEDADMYGDASSDEDDVAFSFFFFMCALASSFGAALSHSSFLWLMQDMAAVIAHPKCFLHLGCNLKPIPLWKQSRLQLFFNSVRSIFKLYA